MAKKRGKSTKKTKPSPKNFIVEILAKSKRITREKAMKFRKDAKKRLKGAKVTVKKV